MSLLTPEAPIIPPVKDHQKMVESMPEDEAIYPASTKSINDLPPELLTKVLEFVILGANRNTILDYRLVNSQWKDIVDSSVEKRIVAGQFPAFPTMNTKIIESHGDVRVSLKCLLDRTTIPFNSLHLEETTISRASRTEPSHLSMMSLSAFATKLGGTLTTLSLCNQKLSIKTLIAMLGPMQNLKRLRFKTVSIVEPDDDVLPNAPFLPCLTTMQVHSRWTFSDDRILYVWLVASFANQLELLGIQTYDPFPPLRARHEYIHSFSSGRTCSIATTSDSAFERLKELKILCPSREFLKFSEIPALRWLSVKDWSVSFKGETTFYQLGDLLTFIENRSSTLETLILNIPWERLISRKLHTNYLQSVQPQMTVGAVAPRLKALKLRYPTDSLSEIVLSNFLLKFPALRKLQLIRFQPHYYFDTVGNNEDGHENVSTEVVDFGNEKNQDEIDALKERLALLFQEMCRTTQIGRVLRATRERLFPAADIRLGEEDEDDAQMLELDAEIGENLRAVKVARNERIAIFKRLSALGENKEKIMVEQLLKRGGFWNSCPSLEIVSASSGVTPDADVCLLRRGDFV